MESWRVNVPCSTRVLSEEWPEASEKMRGQEREKQTQISMGVTTTQHCNQITNKIIIQLKISLIGEA